MTSIADVITGLALRRLAECYALAVDTGNGELLAAQFTPDGVLSAPRGEFVGHAALATVPPMMRRLYDGTFHAVLNQVPTVTGDTASAQTYCIARHFLRDETGGRSCYEMTIRYQDTFANAPAGWRFARRALVVDAARTFPLDEPRH